MAEPRDLVKYLDVFQTDDFGDWVTYPGHLGTADDPIPMPYVDYSDAVLDFEQVVYAIADEHPEFGLYRYSDVLESNGLEWSHESLANADVRDADAQLILAMLMGVIRGDRFCEGLILEFLREGHIQRWLTRLRDLQV